MPEKNYDFDTSRPIAEEVSEALLLISERVKRDNEVNDGHTEDLIAILIYITETNAENDAEPAYIRAGYSLSNGKQAEFAVWISPLPTINQENINEQA